MICKNCSAEYDRKLIKCPYCGTENAKTAQKIKKQILRSYDREAEVIRKEADAFPEKAANKWSKVIIKGIIIVLFAGVLLVGISVLAGKACVSFSYAKEAQHMKKMEKMYLDGDYAEIRKYLNDKNLYDTVYEKYKQVGDVAYYDEWIEECTGSIERNIASEGMTDTQKREASRYWMETILESSARILSKSKSAAEDMFFLENEEVLQEFYDNCIERLAMYGYTDEEISRIENWDGKTDLSEMLPVLEQYFFETGE